MVKNLEQHFVIGIAHGSVNFVGKFFHRRFLIAFTISGGINRLQSMGVNVREISPEMIVMAVRVMANSLKIFPINPPMKSMGIKTAIKRHGHGDNCKSDFT